MVLVLQERMRVLVPLKIEELADVTELLKDILSKKTQKIQSVIPNLKHLW